MDGWGANMCMQERFKKEFCSCLEVMGWDDVFFFPLDCLGCNCLEVINN